MYKVYVDEAPVGKGFKDAFGAIEFAKAHIKECPELTVSVKNTETNKIICVCSYKFENMAKVIYGSEK